MKGHASKPQERIYYIKGKAHVIFRSGNKRKDVITWE